MVTINNGTDELRENLRVMGRNEKRLVELVKLGSISMRFKRYADQIMMLGHNSKEVEVYCRNGDFDMAAKSLGEMRFFLDAIGGILLVKDAARELNGLVPFTEINPENREKYEGLWDYAVDIYERALTKLEKTLEEAA